jgi:hypothetical protein
MKSEGGGRWNWIRFKQYSGFSWDHWENSRNLWLRQQWSGRFPSLHPECKSALQWWSIRVSEKIHLLQIFSDYLHYIRSTGSFCLKYLLIICKYVILAFKKMAPSMYTSYFSRKKCVHKNEWKSFWMTGFITNVTFTDCITLPVPTPNVILNWGLPVLKNRN